jgi:hypothetical protein
MCPENFTMNMRGNWESKTMEFLDFHIKRCSQEYLDENFPGETCASTEEIDALLATSFVNVAMMNQYFDQSDRGPNPIKTVIKTSYIGTNPTLSQN